MMFATLRFVQDLKLGHYLKIPPRAAFVVQSVSTILCVTCQIAVKEWMFSTIPDICERDQPDQLTCPRNRVFYSASAIWCVLIPMRLPPTKTDNQSFVCRCMCEQGPCRPHAAIWAHWRLQLFHVCNAHRRGCAYPVLAVATPVPRHQTQVCQFTRPPQRPHTRSACKWDQLHELVHSWVYLPYVSSQNFSYF